MIKCENWKLKQELRKDKVRKWASVIRKMHYMWWMWTIIVE